MAKKRGGLAGLYDRNKGLIQKAVPAALSFIPGAGIPLAAAAGAAMRGLDRPGKSGIGFDPFAGLKGGVEGAAIGAGTQGVRALLTGGGSMAGMVPKMGGGGLPAPSMSVGVTPGTGGITQAMTAPVAGGGGGGGFSLGKAASSVGNFAKDNKDLIAMAGKGIMSTQPQPGEEAAMMNAETGRMRLEEEQRQAKMEEERKQRIAQLLMPYIQQNYGSMFPRQG